MAVTVFVKNTISNGGVGGIVNEVLVTNVRLLNPTDGDMLLGRNDNQVYVSVIAAPNVLGVPHAVTLELSCFERPFPYLILFVVVTPH